MHVHPTRRHPTRCRPTPVTQNPLLDSIKIKVLDLLTGRVFGLWGRYLGLSDCVCGSGAAVWPQCHELLGPHGQRQKGPPE